MYRGVSAELPSTSRMRPIALWRLWSKSTKVSAGHSWLVSSSRVTRLPAHCSNIPRTFMGWPYRRSLTPLLRNSPACRSSSKVSNRRTRADGAVAGADIETPGSSGKATTILAPRRLLWSAREVPAFHQVIHGENFEAKKRRQGLIAFRFDGLMAHSCPTPLVGRAESKSK